MRKAIVWLGLSVATALMASCLGDDTGPACTPHACTFGQACVDYIAKMSVGTRCITIESATCDPTHCKCAIDSACTSPTGVTCNAVEGGVHIANCLLRD